MPGITYALLIGVEHYHDPRNFPQVTYANRDVDGVHQVLVRLGYDQGDFTLLQNDKATKTAIVQNLKTIAEKALEEDRIIFYFAGHGFYESGKNLLAPVDAIKAAKADTCIAIDQVLGICKTSLCRRTILFLDCCHSGLQAGELERGGEDDFMADELVYQFRNEEYCVGFASCKSNQKSMSMPGVQHGAWSHFLIQALAGEAGKIYKSGILFSDQLQSYLNKETSQYVKMNTVDKRDQTPIKFGSETDKFVIADINPIIEENLRRLSSSALSVQKIGFFGGTYGYVKDLPGFIKGSHTIPKFVNKTTNKFVQEKGHALLEDDIAHIANELREKLKIKRKELRSGVERGAGSIETDSFDYNVELDQEGNNPEQYVIVRRIENIRNAKLMNDPVFNSIFSRHFDNLVFDLNGIVDIASLIDTIEDVQDKYEISISYDPSVLDRCTIILPGAEDYPVEVSPDLICLKYPYKTSPQALIEALKTSRQALMTMPELKLIGI